MFKKGKWNNEINVRNFIVSNYTPYDGDDTFLAPPSKRTQNLWSKTQTLLQQEREAGGVLDIDTKTISTLSAHEPGYIDKSLELIVGVQTDDL